MDRKPISIKELNNSLFPDLTQSSYRREMENERRSPASNVAGDSDFTFSKPDSVLNVIKSFNNASFQLPSDKVSWVNRSEWGAKPPRWTTPLQSQITYVFYTSTRTTGCLTKDICKTKVAAKQSVQMNNNITGKNDIIYNFLIGGDGNIYEGRGWAYRPELPRNFRKLSDRSILIAFVGRYHYQPPAEKMFRVANEIIRQGLYKGCLKQKLVEFILPP